MPRLSIEARAGVAFRSQLARAQPKPPKTLNPEAAALWSSIMADRPADFFRPGNLELLETYCRLTVELRGLMDRLAEPLSDAQRAGLLKTLTPVAGTVVSYARQLRLTVAEQIGRHSIGKLDERGSGSHRLLGGWAGVDRDDGLIGGHVANDGRRPQ